MAVKRKYRLNLRNYGNLPAIMLSQYDEGYALEFEIRDGTDAASDLSAYTVTLKGTRADTLAYSFSGTIATNVLTFVIDTTMTACAGRGTAEIAIKDTANDVLFATFNMPVFVERAAVPEGSIDADVERAQEIAEQVQEIVDNAAAAVSGEAEKWATGQIDGTDVPSTDPAYENNAKYYAEQAADSAASIGIDATLTQAGKAADAKKTGDEIDDLKEDLSDVENRLTALDGGNVDLSYDIVENSYVANTNGRIFSYDGWNRTSYINLKDVSALKIDIPASTVYNYFYKSDQSPLENGNLSLAAGVNDITIPENAAFLICSGIAASINAMTVENVREETEANHYVEYETYKEANLIDYDNIRQGYIDVTGAVHNSSTTWVTDFCELTGDKVYLYKLVVTRYFAFYDENKVKIATWEDTGGMKSLYSGGTLYYLDVPTGAKYFRGTTNNDPETDKTIWVSNYPETPNNFAENNVSNAFPYTLNPTNPCDYSELTVRAFSKAVCIGDSLTYGVFNMSDGSSSTGEGQSSAELALRYSYPSNFQRITGIETTNKGDGGETTVSWYQAYRNDDFSNYDLAIIFLGVNDSAFSVTDADTLTAMQNIVTMLKNARSDMRIAICSCIPAYDRTGYQAKGQLILNWAVELNDPNVIPLDLAKYSHVKSRTSYVAGHLSALGYYMMALDIARYISWYMDHHKRDFRFIQFIGSPDASWTGD